MSQVNVADLTGHSTDKNAAKRIASDVFLTYAKTLLAVAGADGVVSTAEMGYLKHKLTGLGATKEILKAVDDFDWKNADLATLIEELKSANLSGNWPRAILYDAIKVARADNEYDAEEQQAIQKIAALLGIDPNITYAVSGVVEMELVASKVLKALLEVRE